ncbi:MAG: isocitrate/isopropylmalate dehydrogenase family protein [Planctomycetes bacterium]|nr:isocitrate/isopropylmalate dehydrogenase family protein [Planctomycetota bacterium]MCB9919200.1 isocitrate/isopropylmalate dehydrogenase family protein [Planctomycetota bacterium]
MAYTVTLIPGEGIGPEVAAAAQRIVEATGVQIEWRMAEAGVEPFERLGTPLPDATLDAIRETKVALKGPVGTQKGSSFRSVNVAIRRELDLYANFRPSRSVPGVRSRYSDVDLIVVRENTEGLYCGIEHEVAPGVVTSLRVMTENGCRRIVRFAFEEARKLGRKKVTAVHKANILKLGDGMFLRCAQEAAADYPDIAFDDVIIDAAAMKLVLDPTKFDVLVMENLFGDILSDLTSGLVGGLGLAPSANIGSEIAVFEAVHGTAPDIAGKGIANPSALVLSAAMMLRHMGETQRGDAIEAAVRATIQEGETVTGDLGGKASTREFTDAVIAHLG